MRQFKVSREIYTVRNDNINAYLSNINQFPQMSADEEAEVALEMVNGCEKAREKIILSNLRFVVSVAKAYHRNNNFLKLEDLINEGNLGMVEATDSFDPSQGFKFISYAVWQIRRRIRESITKNGRHVKIPENQIWIMNKVNKVYTDYINNHDRFPTIDELWDELQKMEYPPNSTKESLERIIVNYENGTISLDGSSGDPDNDYAPINYIESSYGSSLIEDNDFETIKDELFKGLNGLEIDMVCMRVGIGKYTEPHRYSAIGEKWGMNGETARIRLQKIFKKIKIKNRELLRNLKFQD